MFSAVLATLLSAHRSGAFNGNGYGAGGRVAIGILDVNT